MRRAIFVTVRLKSTRLPHKALRQVAGKPLLGHLLDRLRLSRTTELIVLCTSTHPQDDPLESFARQEQVEIFRGHPDDVVLRLSEAANQFGNETIVSCTGDNPFIDNESLDRLVEFHESRQLDFSMIEGLPFGTFSYCVSASALHRVCDIKLLSDTEVWLGYFTETGLFSTGSLEISDPRIRAPELRLTVDTPEDWNLIEQVFSQLHQTGKVIPLSEIVSLCQQRPEIASINRTVQQKIWNKGFPVRNIPPSPMHNAVRLTR